MEGKPCAKAQLKRFALALTNFPFPFEFHSDPAETVRISRQSK